MIIRACPDGYPSCRQAEATGQWCKDKCKLEKELQSLLKKREIMHEKHMRSYRDGSATRSRTTTHNARISDINVKIQSLRAELA